MNKKISYHPITFVVFTYNEEKRIENVIRNFINFGKVLIADDGSTDGTLEIARKYGCDIYIRENFGYGYVENQPLVDRLYELVDTEWIYWAFADEMLALDTIQEIMKIVKEDKYEIINIDRKNYFMGRFCYNMFHSRTNKCFKKRAIDFSNNEIHGFGKAVVATDKIYTLPDKYYVHHFISNNVSSYINVINRYTEEENGRGYKSSFVFLISCILLLFRFLIKHYLLGKGYKAGIVGVSFLFLMYIYHIVNLMKSVEGLNLLNVDDRIMKRYKIYQHDLLSKIVE